MPYLYFLYISQKWNIKQKGISGTKSAKIRFMNMRIRPAVWLTSQQYTYWRNKCTYRSLYGAKSPETHLERRANQYFIGKNSYDWHYIPLLVKEPLQHIFRIRNWVQHHAPATLLPQQQPLISTGQRAGWAPWLIWNGWRRNTTASPPGIEPWFPNHSARSLVTKLNELSESRFIGVRVFKAALRFVWLQCTTVRLAKSYIHWQTKTDLIITITK